MHKAFQQIKEMNLKAGAIVGEVLIYLKENVKSRKENYGRNSVKTWKITPLTPKDLSVIVQKICLSLFLLETMKRLIDVYIRGILTPQNIYQAQHAYQTDRSVETALHDVVGIVDNALDKKLYVMPSFLDIERAFHNVKISSILKSLSDLEMNQRIIMLTGNMLKDSVINWILEVRRSRDMGHSKKRCNFTKFVECYCK